MTMEITINRQDFENALPVGTSSHDEVFEMVKSSIDERVIIAENEILGDAGVTALQESEVTMEFFKKYVCMAGLLAVFRQLDLTLTSTGFGVINNDTISPASKQRVDALEGALRTQLLRCRAMLLNMLRSDEWGVTVQAKQQLQYLYTDYHYFFGKGDYPSSYDDWNKFKDTIAAADEHLRTHISDEQMDELLDAYRRNDSARLQKYNAVINQIHRYTDAMAMGFKGAQVSYRKIIDMIEKNPAVFDKYPQSDAYKLNHHETFQNTKESSAFLFNG